MNAFLKILEQLLTSMLPEHWARQRFFPFPAPPSGPIELFDACVFHQDASGALGMAWLRCPGQSELMTFPFRIARYSQDGDLIMLPPWSLREASTDALFYSTWKQAFASSGRMTTMRGGALQCRQFDAQSSFNIVNLWTDNKNACTRVETQHLCKIFRVLDPNQPHSVEADMLEYLNVQNHFLQHPELTTRYDFIAANSDLQLPVAIVTRYIQSNAKLWQDLTAKIQHARYPEPMRERSSRLTWYTITETISGLGRMLAEFHIAMSHCRDNALINPEANTSAARDRWVEITQHKLNERIYLVRNLAATQHGFEKTLDDLPQFAYALFEKVRQSEHLGLLIRIHGHAHLGQVLIGEEGIYLVNYETDSLDDEEYRLQKQTCLKDLSATLLSLQFAWLTTDRSEEFPVFRDILGAQSDFGQHVIKSLENFATPVRYTPTLDELENTLVKSYLQSIAEDSTGVELLPEKPSDLESLFDLCILMRVLKETIRDLQHQNPRHKTDLKILSDLVHGKNQKPNFEPFFKSPARSPGSSKTDQNYGVDPDFS